MSALKLKQKNIVMRQHLFHKCSHTRHLITRKERIIWILVTRENCFISHSEWSYLLYAAAPCVRSQTIIFDGGNEKF